MWRYLKMKCRFKGYVLTWGNRWVRFSIESWSKSDAILNGFVSDFCILVQIFVNRVYAIWVKLNLYYIFFYFFGFFFCRNMVCYLIVSTFCNLSVVNTCLHTCIQHDIIVGTEVTDTWRCRLSFPYIHVRKRKRDVVSKNYCFHKKQQKLKILNNWIK